MVFMPPTRPPYPEEFRREAVELMRRAVGLRPDFIQAWRDVAELTGRTIMRNGVWQD